MPSQAGEPKIKLWEFLRQSISHHMTGSRCAQYIYSILLHIVLNMTGTHESVANHKVGKREMLQKHC